MNTGEKPTCKNCRWFDPDPPDNRSDGMGECHLEPPAASYYTPVKPNYWCSHHSELQNKDKP